MKHMICNKGRIFDPIHRYCIIPGTTRNIRNENEEEFEEDEDFQSQHTLLDAEENSKPHGFNCSNREPGKYADPKNCHQYHMCLSPEKYYPYQKLTVQCPKRTAFDPNSKSCTKAAISRCYSNSLSKPTSAINCKSEMRFRERRSCDHYYICYRDQVLKVICPNEFKYNNECGRCMPAHFFKCD